MRRSKSWSGLFALSVAVLVAVMAGCSGSGSGAPVTNTGSVAGEVSDLTSGAKLGGVKITVGGRSVVTDTNGRFRIDGVPVGTHKVIVEPPDFLALPPGAPDINVQVQANQVTTLPGEIVLIDRQFLPPAPPTT